MANNSAEHPDGYLDGATLKSFFAISGNDPSSFSWSEGAERIPDNWYKRAIGDEYTTTFFAADLAAAAATYPQFLSVGGNTGTVGTFTAVDPKLLTGGAYDTASLTKGNAALCFAFQASQQGAPDVLKGSFSNISLPLAALGDALSKALTALSCPPLATFNNNPFDIFPGAKN